MNADDYQKLKEVFQSAFEITGEERERFLDESCRGDASMRREVERLLGSHDSHFLETPPVGTCVDAVSESSSRSGQRIGHYNVQKKIASGGMGDVYLAVDGKLGRRVAIKILPEEFTTDEDRLDRFQLEARSASSLSHPNILTIHEIGEWEGMHYIATEYVEGETLRQRLARGRQTVGESLEIGVQLVSAIAAAHEAGICHRDIKPENVMIRRDGIVKVVDFGLAKLSMSPFRSDRSLGSHDEPTVKIVRTEPGVIMGTVQYMSPEQTRGLATDERSDIWSLGCVLYEMLAGKPPFAGESSADLIAEIVKTHPPALSTFDSEVPERLDEIVAKTLEKNPDERYQTAKDLCIDLKRLKRRFEVEDILERSSPSLPNNSGDKITAAPNIISTRKGPKDLTTVNSAEYLYWGIKAHRWTTFGITLFVISLVGSTALLVRYYWRDGSEVVNPREMPSLSMRSLFDSAPKRQLADSENGVISPDGKLIVYSRVIGERHTLWTKQVATGRSIQINGPEESGYSSMTFSRDSQFIYYSQPTTENLHFAAHRISILGGRPEQLASDISDTYALSPDESQIAYFRSNIKANTCTLFLADTKGANERTLNTRQRPRCYSRLVWSPDGTFLTATVGQSDTGDANIELIQVPLHGGDEVLLSKHKWAAISRLLWHPNGATLLITGRKDKNNEFMNIWQFDPKTDQIEKVTDDYLNYQQFSLTADGGTMLVRRVSLESNLRVGPAESPERSQRLAQASGRVAWLSNRKLVYGSYKSKTLWSVNADGSSSEEIGTEYDAGLAASPDGKYIVTMSAQNGVFDVWRMNSDGTSRIRLTSGTGAQYPTVSPDGKWIYYHSVGNQASAILKVPMDGGEPLQVVPPPARYAAISPNGRYLAYYGILSGRQRDLFVVELESGKTVSKFNLAEEESTGRINWSADGKYIYFATETPAHVANLWRQDVAGGKPKRITNFSTDQIFDFAFSPDYQNLAVIRGRWVSEMVLVSLAPPNAESN